MRGRWRRPVFWTEQTVTTFPSPTIPKALPGHAAAPADGRASRPHKASSSFARVRARAPLVTWLPVVAVLVPLTILGGASWLEWRAGFAEAGAELRRAAGTGAEYGARTLQGYVAAASRLNERLRGLSDEQIREQELHLHTDLRRLVAEHPQSELTFILDREARPLVATSVYPVPRSGALADRDYHLALAAPDRPAFFVSRQFIGRFDDRLLFTIAKPRRDTGNDPHPPDGFEGTVALSIDPNSLAEGLRRISTPPDRLNLVHDDGHILGRSTGQQALLPPVDPASPFHGIAAARARSAVYESTSTGDGQPMLIAVQRLEGFDIYAVALRPREAVVARWREEMAGHLIFGVPATLALLLLSLRVRRDQLRLSEANALLEQDVERGVERLNRAAQMGLVGTFEFDLRTGISMRSAEYMSVAGHPSAPAVESHGDWVSRLHPDDRERAEAYLLEAVSDTSGITEYAQTYRILTPKGEIRWIAARGEIERDGRGRTVVMRGAHVDVTPLRETQIALAESDARLRLAQEAVGIGTWEWSPSARTLTWSAKMIELWGFDPAEGQPPLRDALARVHPLDRVRLRREFAAANRSGHLRSELRILRPTAGGEAETIWIVLRARLLTSGTPHGNRLVGVAYDVTERKHAEEHTAMLAHEVEHRAKNMLTIISGLVRVTKGDTHEEYVEILGGRIEALAGTLALLSRHSWKGATIEELLRHELEPFVSEDADAPPRVTLSGPELVVDAEVAQALSIAVHELTTNAAKYGALSVPEGKLDVRWDIDHGVVALTWRETGGPALNGPPQRMSFGSQLIVHSLRAKLGGEIEKEWRESGLVCRMRFALEGERG